MTKYILNLFHSVLLDFCKYINIKAKKLVFFYSIALS